MLLDNAFGNFRDVLGSVTLSPAMGLYLDMRRNDKGGHHSRNPSRTRIMLAKFCNCCPWV